MKIETQIGVLNTDSSKYIERNLNFNKNIMVKCKMMKKGLSCSY